MTDAVKGINLTPEASFANDTGFVWGDKNVANFCPIVHGNVIMKSEGVAQHHVRFCCLLTDGTESELYTVPITELETIDWFSLNPKFLINPDCRRAPEYLAHIIRCNLISADTVNEQRLDRLGTHITNDMPSYFTGDRHIQPLGYGWPISAELTWVSTAACMRRIFALTPPANYS
ncbi:MAG: hypothetical protein FWG94_10230 [Oscillospiraceae bacterium]|nr:hypothetical protein [Oscillospiraceae bacterium]